MTNQYYADLSTQGGLIILLTKEKKDPLSLLMLASCPTQLVHLMMLAAGPPRSSFKPRSWSTSCCLMVGAFVKERKPSPKVYKSLIASCSEYYLFFYISFAIAPKHKNKNRNEKRLRLSWPGRCRLLQGWAVGAMGPSGVSAASATQLLIFDVQLPTSQPNRKPQLINFSATKTKKSTGFGTL